MAVVVGSRGLPRLVQLATASPFSCSFGAIRIAIIKADGSQVSVCPLSWQPCNQPCNLCSPSAARCHEAPNWEVLLQAPAHGECQVIRVRLL